MSNLVLLFVVTFLGIANSLPDPAQLIKENGYPSETHSVTTEDGYITTLHRIPHGKDGNDSISRPPVMISHGMGSSSADFINAGPGKSLGYVLADAGYDVWLSNARGNSYSQHHVTLDPVKDAKAFYNFSWHDIGVSDYPAQIDYILNATGEEKLFYIGHSQGGTAYFILTSLRPEYNEKIRLGSLMGPSGIMKHTSEILIRLASEFIYQLEVLTELIHIYHLPFPELIRIVLSAFCSIKENEPLCRFGYSNFGGGYEDYEQTNATLFPTIFKTTPSDLPLKSAFHYGQLIKSGEFRQFDYGKEGNMAQYGTEEPPSYDFSLVAAPTAIYYGKNDEFVAVEDVDTMTSLMPNIVNKYLVKWDKWSHGDFLYAIDVIPLLYDELLRVMSEY